MKYHSTASTIIISILITLMFLFVSVFILSSLNLTSPTLMLANKLFDSWESVDSNVSVSFDSIERNLRDRVYINGLSIKYNDHEILRFDNVKLEKGLFSMLGYIFTGNGVLKVNASNGFLDIPHQDNSISIKKGDSSESFLNNSLTLKIPDELFSWGIDMKMENVDISYNDILVKDSNFSLYFDHGLDGMKLSMEMPYFGYSFNAIGIEGESILFKIYYDDSFKISALIEDAMLEYEDVSLSLNGLNAKIDAGDFSNIKPIDIPVELSAEEIDLTYQDANVQMKSSSIKFEDRSLNFTSLDALISKGIYSLAIGKTSIDTSNLNNFSSTFSKMLFDMDGKELFKANSLDLGIDLDKKKANISIPRLESGLLGDYSANLVNSIVLSSFESDIDYLDAIKIDANALAVLSSKEDLIDGTSFTMNLNSKYIDESIEYNLDIPDFKIPKLEKTLSLSLSGENKKTSFSLNYGQEMNGSVSFDDKLDLSLDFNSLYLFDFMPVISTYLPILTSYISDETVLDGNISTSVEENAIAKYGFSGNLEYNVDINNIRFNESSFGISSKLELSLGEQEVSFKDFAFETDWLDITYNGSLSFASNLPEGHFEIVSASGKPYFLLDMVASNLKEYTFHAESPYVNNSYISGVVNFATDNLISSDAVISLFNRVNPFDLKIDLEEKHLTMDNDNIDIDVSWANILDISILFDSLPLSPSDESLNISTLDMDVKFEFDFAKQSFLLDIPHVGIMNFYSLSTEPAFSFSAHGDNNSIKIDDILLTVSGFNSLSGSAVFDILNRKFVFSLSDGSGEMYIASVMKEVDSYFGIIRGENINLGRFGLSDMVGNFNLSGRAEKLKDFAFSGNFNAISNDTINDQRRIKASILIDNNQFRLSDFEYSNSSLTLTLPLLAFDSTSGYSTMENADLLLSLSHSDRPYTISASISSEISVPKATSLLESFFSLAKTKCSDMDISLTLDYLDVDSNLRVEKKEMKARIDEGKLKLSGSFVSGDYDFSSGDIDLDVDIDPIAVFSINGNLKNNKSFSLDFEKFAVSLANLYFPSPILIFYDPAYISGELNIVISDDGVDAFGALECEYAEFDVWWLPNERVILHNATFVVWDNDIVSILTDASVLNQESYEIVPAKIKLGMYFDDFFGFDSWELDVYISDPYKINFRLPLVNSNIDIKGKVSGHYKIIANSDVVNNSGDVVVDDVELSIGLDELPQWWNTSLKTTSDFDVLLRSNIQLLYPLGPSPIIRANISDNTKIGFSSTDSGFNISGEIPIRSGEIYYFQKYFYITEGNVAFRDSLNGIYPIINLRARLRDFDSNGDSVDIYLVLRDATLDNLSPSFESSPNKDLNEILSILGQAILPTSAYGETSLTTVVSMAAASVDVLSKVGILGSVDDGLSSTIRDSLSIDTFSLHTNILSNLVADTVSFASSSPELNTLSPMARYLDGTSLYIGKYLSPDFYLQAMVHLSANRNNEKNSFSFIADDLTMDTEISLEWDNPLCTVTFFSQPVNLTPYGLMENFGFSFRKRIVF